jgi:hypothetical protein
MMVREGVPRGYQQVMDKENRQSMRQSERWSERVGGTGRKRSGPYFRLEGLQGRDERGMRRKE